MMKDLKILLFEARTAKKKEASALLNELRNAECVSRTKLAEAYAALDELDALISKAGLIIEYAEYVQRCADQKGVESICL